MRVSGRIFFKIDGVLRSAIGDFTYNLGIPKKTAVVGATQV